jgi:hypothetical protein
MPGVQDQVQDFQALLGEESQSLVKLLTAVAFARVSMFAKQQHMYTHTYI